MTALWTFPDAFSFPHIRWEKLMSLRKFGIFFFLCLKEIRQEIAKCELCKAWGIAGFMEACFQCSLAFQMKLSTLCRNQIEINWTCIPYSPIKQEGKNVHYKRVCNSKWIMQPPPPHTFTGSWTAILFSCDDPCFNLLTWGASLSHQH